MAVDGRNIKIGMAPNEALRVAINFTLPLDYVTQTGGLLAVRGAGKSNAGAVMAEEMFRNQLPFVAIDPVGSWSGLRSGPDGSPKGGLSIPIFGGKQGDVPLERGAGELIADLVVDDRLSCVLDLSEFASEAAKKEFLTKFAQRLYQRNRDPLHLFLEEADDYIPQKPMRDEAILLRAWENIVRRGRSRGLGMTLITQRSAAINKMVLTQVETLFVLRTTGPQDIKAIEGWVKYHQVDDQLLASLAGLEDGEAWVWSPHFLKGTSRIKFHKRSTFDSGATPKNLKGNASRKVATLADIDLGLLRGRIKETIERAKADDPKELKRRIVELERAAKAKVVTPSQPKQKVEIKRIEVPTIKDSQLTKITGILDRTVATIKNAEALVATLEGAALDLQTAVKVARELASKSYAIGVDLGKPGGDMTATVVVEQPSGRVVDVHVIGPGGGSGRGRVGTATVRPAEGDGVKLDQCQMRLLAVIDHYGPITLDDACVIARYAPTSRRPKDAMGVLRTLGFVVGVNSEGLTATDEGRAQTIPTPFTMGPDCAQYWLGYLPACERALLRYAINNYPRTVTLEEACVAGGYEVTSRRPKDSAGAIRSLKMIHGPNSGFHASRLLVDRDYQEGGSIRPAHHVDGPG